MIQILLVDDEPEILRGLRRALRVYRAELEAICFDRPQEALDHLRVHSADVVVSDMQMPGMDGLQFLQEVKARHPQMIRLVLSGQVEPARVLEAAACAHQILPKPCRPEVLRETIVRSFHLGTLLEEPRLKALVARLSSLPCRPAVHERIVASAESGRPDLAEIAELASADLGVVAKMLQLANFETCGAGREVVVPAEAARILGVDTIRALIHSLDLYAPLEDGRPPEALGAVAEHSFRVAAMARALARELALNESRSDHASLAGILHDTGKLVLATWLPEEQRRAQARATRQEVATARAEYELLGASHAEIGGSLLGMWGVPEAVAEAIAFHHRPREYDGEHTEIVLALHVANGMDHVLAGRAAMADAFDREFLAREGQEHRLEDWAEVCAQSAREERPGKEREAA